MLRSVASGKSGEATKSISDRMQMSMEIDRHSNLPVTLYGANGLWTRPLTAFGNNAKSDWEKTNQG